MLLALRTGWLLLAALSLAVSAQAQAPAWTRAVTGVPNPLAGTVVPKANAADAAGNVYVAGYFTGRVEVGGTIIESAGGQDAFVAKWNSATATWTWVRTAGGTGNDRATGLALSGSNVYVTGAFSTTAASFGSTVLSSAGGTDVFVAKLTDAGSAATWTWAVRGGGSDDDEATALAAQGSSVYTTGYYNSGDARFGSTMLVYSSTYAAIFAAKLTDSGSSVAWSWAQNISNSQVAIAGGIAAGSGGVYISGAYSRSATFGTRTLQSVGADDAFVAKLNDATGAWTWAYSIGGSNSDYSRALAVTGSTVYLTGDYDSYDFRLGTTLTLPGAGSLGSRTFVAKLTDAGTTAGWTWATATSGAGTDRAGGVAVGSSGSVYVSGTFNSAALTFGSLPAVANAGGSSNTSDGYVARLTDAGSTATWAWATASGGIEPDGTESIAANSTGVFPLSIFFSPVATFGSALNSPLQTGGQNTLVVGALSSTGTWQAVQSINAGGASIAGAVVALPNDDAYVTGTFSGQLDIGTTRLVSHGSYDVFVAKWDARRAAWAWAIGAGGTSSDSGTGIALGPDGVFVTGTMANASFGSISVASRGVNDAFVAKVSEASGSPAWSWAIGAGGSANDAAARIAVSGSSVYVCGNYSNSAFFGTTTLPSDNNGHTNGFVGKLLDGGTSATWTWAAACGGTGNDAALDLLTSGSSVYVCGSYGSAGASFGTQTLAGNGTSDAFVARLTDNGATSTWAWAQRAGGANIDEASALALNGNSLYVAGTTYGPSISFGSITLPAPGSADMYVAKLNLTSTTPTWAWATVAGSAANSESISGLALRGSNLYVSGYFGGPFTIGSTLVTNVGANDVLMAKLVDNGSTGTWAWGTGGGGITSDNSRGIAIGNQTVYLAGTMYGTSTFGPIAVPATGAVNVLAALVDTAIPLGILPQQSAAATPLTLSPNPASTTFTITLPGTAEARTVTVLDAVGRAVRQAVLPARATALSLPLAGLAPGVYVVRAGASSGRLVVE